MVKAYSKVNLILKVYKKKQTESKHKIKSLFLLNKTFYDEINIVKSNKLSISYYLESKKTVLKDCLVKKALFYLKNKFQISTNYSIKITKKINIMSGLGGGSSDAASVILYVLKDKKIPISKLNMKEIALQLGSDIPFFLSKTNAAIVSGYGEKVKEIKMPKLNYKVNLTNIKVSTKIVFDALVKDKEYSSKVNFDKCLNSLLNKKFDNHYIYNDLQAYIFKVSNKISKKFNEIKTNNKIICGAGGSILLLN